jgi:hypothetical protein
MALDVFVQHNRERIGRAASFHKTNACLCAVWNIAETLIRVTLSHA